MRLVVGRRLDDGNARRLQSDAACDSAAGHHGGARGRGQQFASGELVCCHAQPQKKFRALLRSRHQQVQRRFRQRPAGQLGRRAVAVGQAAVSHQSDAQPVQRVGGAAFAKKAIRHVQRRLGFAGAHPAQGGQRHPGGFRVGRRLIAECAHRSVIPAAAQAHAPQQEVGGPHRSAAGSPRRAGGPFPFPAPEWPARSVPPTPPSRESRASPEIRARAWRHAQQPLTHAVRGGGFFPGRAQQPVDGARMGGAAELVGRQQGHQRGHPRAFIESDLRRPAAIRQLRGPQPVRGRGAPARVRRRPAKPGWRRPSAPSRRIPGRRANRHPDSVCSPQVGSTL